MSLSLELLSVNVGRPAHLGYWRSEPVLSGIRKTPLAGSHVLVGKSNIQGDGQADLSVHGGFEKAIYVYPADHWSWWKQEANFEAESASFGENLTLNGADEHVVRIGDRFTWGHVMLEVSQPRAPCFKFAMLTGREDLGRRMTISTRTGWYFRVLREGEAPVSGTLARTKTDDTQPSVHETFVAVYHPRVMSNVVEKVLAAPALSQEWRRGVEKRLRAALKV